jgi:hypothetical protein
MEVTGENDSVEILTQVLMALPEDRLAKPSSRTPGARQQIRSITFRAVPRLLI